MTATTDQIAAGRAAQATLNDLAAQRVAGEGRGERIYLAGPMTGLPKENYPAFNAATARLRCHGYHVENPAETPEQLEWTGWMRHALAKLVTCDRVMLMPGWESSRGANVEVANAHILGIPVMPVIVSPIPEETCDA